MTTPTYLPTGFDGTYKDYLKAKVDKDGCLRMQYRPVTVADNATAGTTYGVVPFQRGFRLSMGGTKIYTTDLDTAANTTLNIGYVYKTGSSFTDDPDAFASAVSAQTAGFISFDEEEGLYWVAEDDGWIQIALAGGPVTTAGTIYNQIVGCYDSTTGVLADN